jgi:hypothetical protein
LLDPQKRDWQFHAQSAIVFCLIHYQRGVERLVGHPSQNKRQWEMLMDIPNCQSKEEYMTMCDLIISKSSYRSEPVLN